MRRFALAFGATVVCLLALIPTTLAQQPQVQNETVLRGVLTSVWGDPQANDPLADVPRLLVHLTDAAGMTSSLQVSELVLEAAGGLRSLTGREVVVTVAGRAADPSGQQQPRADVRAIRLASREEMISAFDPAPEPLAGPQPRAVILCRFSDSTAVTPKPASYFTGLLSAAAPGLNHYWREVSYGNINLDGTQVFGWYNLPNPRSYYVYDQNGDGVVELNFGRAVTDCTGVADPDVYFPNFKAIDLNFNQDLDCCAWGGSSVVARDGVSRVYGLTWMPPWSQTIAVYAHESGHSLGFPHSSGPYANTYDSQWDPMSSPDAACRNRNPTYGCVPVHTIMYHKDLDQWIPVSRRFDTPPNSHTTITIERSALPGSSGYLFAKIPIGTSTTNYYTVEARRFVGYDNEIPGQAIVIHNVLTTRNDRNARVVDADNNGNPNDAGAMWTPGESFIDTVNKISVSIGSPSGNGYSVTISVGLAPDNRIDDGDFDGDGKAEVSVFRPSNGTWYIRYSGTPTSAALVWGGGDDVPVAGDYDGDGMIDLAAFRPSTGTWSIRHSGTPTTAVVTWGGAGDVPVPVDFDGDGKTDIAVFRPSNGTWYIRYSGTPSSTALVWGGAGDVAVPDDYDGDRKADIAVFRPSNGTWYIRYSGTPASTTLLWGGAGDVAVQGDYDGDAKADIAVFRPSNGTWYIRYSGTPTSTTFVWGGAGDVAVPGDYDGDGKADIAVFRPSNGTWYIRYSGTPTSAAVTWGGSGDMPILERP